MAWRPRIKIGSGSKFMGLVEAIEEDIRSSIISPGERMPAQRTIAAALGVDLTTVTRAFNEAKLRGILVAHRGRAGTSVAGGAPHAALLALAKPVDLTLNIPPQPARADLAGRISRSVSGALKRGADLLQYNESMGSLGDRLAGAGWLADLLGEIDVQRILVASGAQTSLHAIFSFILRRGDRIGMGAVSYPGAVASARRTGAIIVPLDMDQEGIVPASFEKAARAGRLKALYVVPTADNPTTATMSEHRRQSIVAIALRHNVYIIEDDPYRRLVRDAPPAIASMQPDLVFHVATLSKCATPGLRIAYVVAPTAALAHELGEVLRCTSLMASPLMAALATRWIGEGTLTRVVEEVRMESAEREQIAAKILAGETFSSEPGAHHLWLKLPDVWTPEAFTAAAGSLGIGLIPASSFATGSFVPNSVRVGIGASVHRSDLRAALLRLHRMIHASPSLPECQQGK